MQRCIGYCGEINSGTTQNRNSFGALGAWLSIFVAPAFLVDNGYHETNLTPFRMIAMYGRVLRLEISDILSST